MQNVINAIMIILILLNYSKATFCITSYVCYFTLSLFLSNLAGRKCYWPKLACGVEMLRTTILLTRHINYQHDGAPPCVRRIVTQYPKNYFGQFSMLQDVQITPQCFVTLQVTWSYGSGIIAKHVKTTWNNLFM